MRSPLSWESMDEVHPVRKGGASPSFLKGMEPRGQARGTQKPYPPTPLGAEALRCASAKASVGHPPVSEIRRSRIH